MSNELLTRLKAQSSELKEICFKSVFGMALRDVSPKGFFFKTGLRMAQTKLQETTI